MEELRQGTFFAPSGSRFGSLRCPGNRDVPNSCKKQRKTPLSGWKAVFLWLRGLDLNQRPPGYELPSVSPFALAQCFPGLFEPEIAQNPKVVPLRSAGIFGSLGHGFGSHRNAGCLNGLLKNVPIRFRVSSDTKALRCQGPKTHRNTKRNWEKNFLFFNYAILRGNAEVRKQFFQPFEYYLNQVAETRWARMVKKYLGAICAKARCRYILVKSALRLGKR